MSNLIVQGEEWGALQEQAKLAVRSGFLPQSIKTEAQAIIIGIKARELDLPLMAGFSLINVINGKPALSAEGMLAVIYKRFPRAVIAFKSMTNKACVIEAQREPSQPKSTFEFTIEDAAQAGLAQSVTWKKYPRALLKARCISEMARTIFPDALIGASYTPEELGDDSQGHELETRSVNMGTGEVIEPIPQVTRAQEFEVEETWPQANNLVIGLKDLVKAQQELKLEASQVSEVIKEVTGRDRAGDCTKPELATVLQALRDRFGK